MKQIVSKRRVKDFGEVYTHEREINSMLDLVKEESYRIDSLFLEPACGNGNFLVKILKRKLMVCLSKEDVKKSLSSIHAIDILKDNVLESKQRLYELVKEYLTESEAFLIMDQNIVCGDSLELLNHEFYRLMKFDVIIGNPPYQLSTGGASAQATPLYDKFIEQAKKLRPRYLTMIIPSRWFAGGMGLDSFRESMLTERKIRHITDYTNAKDCFSGVSLSGGVCFFLWDRDYEGDCEFTNVNSGKSTTLMRKLDEFPVFVRYNEAISIIHKVQAAKEESISSIVSALSPYGLGSAERGNPVQGTHDVVLYSSKGKGYYPKSLIKQGCDYLDKYHIMMSKVTSEHAGEPSKDGTFKVISKMQVLKPNEVCTFSYFLVGNFDTETETQNCLGYLATKFARFLLLQAVSSINISKDKFRFVPMQDFSKSWTDQELYAKYGLTQEEIDYIESMIRPMN